MKALVYGVAPEPFEVPGDGNTQPETFEVGVRVLRSRGTLVKAGVHAPGRWEWSPLYFKEISWVGLQRLWVRRGRRAAQARHRALP
jgi:hypothetical protein